MTIGAGPETLVNSTTASDQYRSSVTTLTDGGWIITWLSYQNLSSDPFNPYYGWGIWQQRYTADGIKSGTETRVNATIDYDTDNPQVAGLEDGGWVVTWESLGQDGSGYGVFQQRFDKNGVLYGNETQVNNAIDYGQYDQDVIGLPDGGWLVSWTSFQNGNDVDVYFQRYDVNGAEAGPETRANSSTLNSQGYSEITLLKDGGWIVTWDSFQDGNSYDVYQQRYRANGNTFGTETRVNTASSDYQGDPSVAALDDGGWVVAWNSTGQDGNESGIYLQRYDASGARVGSETLVNTTVINDQQEAEITGLADGGWVVTWVSRGQEDPFNANEQFNYGVYQQQFDKNGNKIGGEILVNSFIKGSQFDHEVAALDDGGWVVTWTSTSQDVPDELGYYGVYQKAFRPTNDAPTAANGTVTTAEDTPYHFSASDFQMQDGDGNALLAVIIDGFNGNGQLTLNGGIVNNGQVVPASSLSQLVWTPSANANGQGLATLTFRVQDNGGTKFGGVDTSVASYTISLGASVANDAPVLAQPLPDLNATEDSFFQYTIDPGTFTDAETANLTYSATLLNGAPLPSWLTFTPGSRTFSGTPLNEHVGTIQIRVTASDGSLSASDVINLQVFNTNDAPTVVNETGMMNEGEIAAINVLANDSDADGDSLSISSAAVISNNATVTINNGTLNIDYTGVDLSPGATAIITVTYDVYDGKTKTAGTVTLSVNGEREPGDDIIDDDIGNTIEGTALGETIKGMGGDDIIFGLDGNDNIWGGKGKDKIEGGAGKDVFHFVKGDGKDIIYDFSPSERDDLDISSIAAITSWKDLVKNHMREKGGDLQIVISKTDIITLDGLDKGDVHKSDFII
ncbi:Ig-like domain-containing protein [Rhizobium sp.]